MKISIITPVYKGAKNLEKFLDKMKDQTSKNYEVILVVDTNNDNVLAVVDKYNKILKTKLKVAYNSKRFSRTNAINLGAKIATGDYSMIMSLQNSFGDKMVSQVIELINEKKSDIIEFRAKFSAPIKFDGKIRKAYNKPVSVEKTMDIQAFTFPLDFNKLFKTSVLVESAKYKLPIQLNSRYSIDATYLPLLVAKTYSTSNKVIITAKSKLSENFNPLKMIRQWESLIKLVGDYTSLETTNRYTYAQYYAEAVFMAPLVKATRNKITNKKFNEKFKKQQVTIFADIFETNRYATMKSNEHDAIRKYTTITTLNKIHKEIG